MPTSSTRLFLSGDVMTGRGIDQILQHPSDPMLHESLVVDARDYVQQAEEANGPIPRAVGPAYPWGDVLGELERAAPDARIVNLETAVTRSRDWEAKGINYRMHPENLGVLTAARIDVCALANNHLLDWGEAGLIETLTSLDEAGLSRAGAGLDIEEARAPAVVPLERGRVLVFSCATTSSGVPPRWAASEAKPGVFLLPGLSGATAKAFSEAVRSVRRPGDLVVASIHWGGNWGLPIPPEHRRFAHALIEAGAADLIHGHSSHHPLGIEVHRGRLILYGCGDFIDDYEGITGHEAYRPELRLLYLPELEIGSGRLRRLRMVPMRAER